MEIPFQGAWTKHKLLKSLHVFLSFPAAMGSAKKTRSCCAKTQIIMCVCVNATIAATVLSLCFHQEHRRKEKDIAVKLGFEFHRGYTQAIMASSS